jgi:hypothetical protein
VNPASLSLYFLLMLPPADGSPVPQQPDGAREERAAQDQNWVERQRAKIEWLTDRGIYPKVETIVSGSGLAFGVELRKEQLFGRLGASFETMWSIRGYRANDVKIGAIHGATERVELRPADNLLTSTFEFETDARPGTSVYVHARHRVYPRIDFFGLNQTSTRARRSDFSLTGPSVDVVLQWQPTPELGFGARAGVLSLEIDRGSNDRVPDLQDSFTAIEAPGIGRRNPYITIGAGGVLDRRWPADLPTQGGSLAVAVWRFEPIETGTSAFTRYVVDGRQLFELAGPNHVLALAAVTSLTHADGEPAPFHLQSTLGGSRTLRGLGSYRLRGPFILHGASEYRWRVHRRIELAGFVDAGSASRSVRTIAGDTVVITPGAGIRVLSRTKRIARLDWGWGPDGHRFVITVDGPY